MMLLQLAIACFMTSTLVFAEKLQEEKEVDVVNFNNVKEVLTQDGLMTEAIKKKEQVAIIAKERKKEEAQRFRYPNEADFWGFATEYWLVKQAPILKWDFEKPDYGLEVSLANLFKSVGLYQKRFRVLLTDSPTIPHLGLPYYNGQTLLLLSVPFVRSMDLSKLEISILLLEDFFRVEEGWLKEAVRPKDLSSWLGTSFEGKKPDYAPLESVARGYQGYTTGKGFSFSQQFAITKKMDAILKSSPELWNAYIRLLNKIDRLVKLNTLYSNHNKLYPSPEMQIKWLSPEEKAL